MSRVFSLEMNFLITILAFWSIKPLNIEAQTAGKVFIDPLLKKSKDIKQNEIEATDVALIVTNFYDSSSGDPNREVDISLSIFLESLLKHSLREKIRLLILTEQSAVEDIAKVKT